VNFAKTGNPHTTNIPNWPKFDARHRSTMIFSAETRVVNDPYAALRAFWAEMPGPHSVIG